MILGSIWIFRSSVELMVSVHRMHSVLRSFQTAQHCEAYDNPKRFSYVC
jgi:hypothetical protein